MLKIKPQNPKGVRDFLPQENQRREYIISILKKHFELYGFASIYTPAFERLETLQGKYGDEGDKLLFKILNSGDYLTASAISSINSGEFKHGDITREIASKGLRYDLTVPLARLVAQFQNDMAFPFKRYQIAPVWRADRPQKGRYQEFFQCDVDIVGSKGLVSDVELISLINDVFKELKLKVEIKLNNRKIFNGICQEIGMEKEAVKVSTILDKWDKIGEEKIREELGEIIGQQKTSALISLLGIQSLEELEQREDNNEQLKMGLAELKYIVQHTEGVKFDLRLLRGLDYYTGTVIEVTSSEIPFGSLLGGGRYDDLTELFGLKDISGIGVSFGLDRIYDVMNELNRFPEALQRTKILVLNLEEKAESLYYELLRELRKESIAADLYPTRAKIDKQLTYADKSNYTHALILGEKEIQDGCVQLKDLSKREQETFQRSEFISKAKQFIQLS